MRIRRLSSTKFRNLQHDPLTFSPHVNTFVGANGHGKTNTLEAIHFFKFGRSFRTSRDVELVCFDEPFCRVEVETESANGECDVYETAIERNGAKRIKLNGKEVSRYSELVGRFPCVIFGPQDLAIVAGQPAERRRFLDMVGSLTTRGYLEELREYRRVLAQRNAALKARRADEAQGVWAEKLIQAGCRVVAGRVTLVEAINSNVETHLERLGIENAITLSYESELTRNRPEKVSCEEQFAAKLAAVELEEMRRTVTLVGPHRDDLRILGNGLDLRRFGSQGQRRLAAILLRLAELSLIEERLKEPSVLMLDDIFSELDPEITEKLKKALENDRQVFITSPSIVEWQTGGESRTFHVSEGTIERAHP